MSIMCAAKTSLTARERFDLYLRSNHKRRTVERFAIMDRVLRAPGHVSAEELCKLMKDDGYPVSAATVYSTLELLVDCGLLVRQRFNDKASLYEKGILRHHIGTPSPYLHVLRQDQGSARPGADRSDCFATFCRFYAKLLFAEYLRHLRFLFAPATQEGKR